MLPVLVRVATRLPPPLTAQATVATRPLLARATRLKLTKATNSPSVEATNSHDKHISRAQPRLLSISSKAQGRDMVLLAAATEQEQQPSSLL